MLVLLKNDDLPLVRPIWRRWLYRPVSVTLHPFGGIPIPPLCLKRVPIIIFDIPPGGRLVDWKCSHQQELGRKSDNTTR
jgi:hypothetical protein